MPLRASAGLRVPVAAGVESPGHLCVPVAAGAETPAGEVMSGEIDIDRGSLIGWESDIIIYYYILYIIIYPQPSKHETSTRQTYPNFLHVGMAQPTSPPAGPRHLIGNFGAVVG